CPQLEENAASPLLIARSEPMADASLPDIRARSRPGTAIAAMMPMMATTISSSMRVKPLDSRIFIALSLNVGDCPALLSGVRIEPEQRRCQGSAVRNLAT